MPDQLYAIDTAAATLAALPAPQPNVLTLTLRQQPSNGTILEAVPNFTGQDLAILFVAARASSLNGYSSTYAVDMRIGSSSFLSSGSASSLVIPAVGSSATSFAPLWSADPEDAPVWGSADTLYATGTHNLDLQVAVDVCMIPASQLSLLEV